MLKRFTALLLLLLINIVCLYALTSCKSVKVSNDVFNSAGFLLTGDPTNANGASWTYNSTDDGVVYSIKGILFKPPGDGPFPAVIVSHGKGGSVNTYSSNIAKEMVNWGCVVIATNYTHAYDTLSTGMPGTSPQDDAASPANLQRAHKCRDILSSLSYVDINRVAAHGHSMGAMVTTALVAAYPDDFKVASHTAGGIHKYLTQDLIINIKTPYLISHGSNDSVVPFSSDESLSKLLTANNVRNRLDKYEGYSHAELALDSKMLKEVNEWYLEHGLLQKSSFNPEGLTIKGDPESTKGAVWNYESTDEGIYYNIKGILMKPIVQTQTFNNKMPAVIINHGRGGGAYVVAANVGKTMRSWGLAVIAVNLTHANGEAGVGSPGVAPDDFGCSKANILRAHKCYDILNYLNYIDMSRVALHGHSMGAFLTVGLAGSYPDDFRAVSHTAGGLDKANLNLAGKIKAPYHFSHGLLDKRVEINYAERLDEILDGVTVHEFIKHENLAHTDISNNLSVMDDIQSWYKLHGILIDR